MAEINYAELKKGGFMRQCQAGKFSLRLRVAGGQLTAEKLAKIREIAEKFGNGYVHLTSRQGVEIPFIDVSDMKAVTESLAEAGLSPGACGPRVRTVTACQGASICPSGLIETSGLAAEIDARYFGKELPHKFKIGITGCKNNCLKAEENDFGIKGGALPEWNKSACTLCGLCEAVCPVKAISQKNEELALDEKICIYCGKCEKSCPSDAWNGKRGYIVSFGGMFGNQIAHGESPLPIIFTKEKLLQALDAAMDFYRENGKSGERLGLTLKRLGIPVLRQYVGERLK
ncbi:MAG: 4Fe-4S binding protein [Clostridiaceae bacterium]|jgi:dissimilatory sulfite reductase (desulfoviridin) alpha/beta subunit|nr:4Fe-4S binding protein [Clostridiaceae bacterium]